MKYNLVTLTIEGISNYSQCAYLNKPTVDSIDKPDETPARELWIKRMHLDSKGRIYIPPMSIHKCLVAGARHLGHSVPGKGKKQFAGYFSRGVIASEPFVTTETFDTAHVELLHLDGQPSKNVGGAGSRVPKRMPYIEEGWKATGQLMVMEECITEREFQCTVEAAGLFIGIGRFRPENGGFYGRFKLVEADFKTVER